MTSDGEPWSNRSLSSATSSPAVVGGGAVYGNDGGGLEGGGGMLDGSQHVYRALRWPKHEPRRLSATRPPLHERACKPGAQQSFPTLVHAASSHPGGGDCGGAHDGGARGGERKRGAGSEERSSIGCEGIDGGGVIGSSGSCGSGAGGSDGELGDLRRGCNGAEGGGCEGTAVIAATFETSGTAAGTTAALRRPMITILTAHHNSTMQRATH